MPLRPRRGWGVRLSEALEQMLGSVSMLRDSSPVPGYCFLIPHWVIGRNRTPPHPHHRGQQSIKPLPQGSVCLANQSAGPKQAVPTPAPKCPGYLSPTATMLKERELPSCVGRLRAAAHPSPSPFRASGLGRNLSCLTKSKWRRKEGGWLARTPLCLTLQQSPPQTYTHSFSVANKVRNRQP